MADFTTKRNNTNFDISNLYVVTEALLEIKCLGFDTEIENHEIYNISNKHVYTELYSGIFNVEQDFFYQFAIHL